MLHQIGLDHVFDGVARFGESGRERFDADGAAGIGFDQSLEIAAVEQIEAVAIDFEALQRAVGDFRVDRAVASAKSRTRRSKRTATRGVPRARLAISIAPSAVIGAPSFSPAR